MSETDRVRVPTNGHRPPLEAVGDASTSADSPGEGPADDPLGETGPQVRIEVTPRHLAAGLGVLVGLVLLIAGTRRRGTGGRG